MKIEQEKLIVELARLTNVALNDIRSFKRLSAKQLNYKTSPESWSILECIEHLNLYGKFYLPEIEKQLLKANKKTGNLQFKSGILGEYFVGVIKVDGKKKMKATRAMDPTNSNLNSTSLDQFIKQLETLKNLLNESREVNLKNVKTAISLSKLIKLRLGDTLRFLVFHNERHIIQAKRIPIN